MRKIKRTSKKHSKLPIIAISGLVAILAIGAVYTFVYRQDSQQTTTSGSDPFTTQTTDSTSASAVQNNISDQNEMLVYLIEEEKLAHDVYTVMYNIYGAKVFGNILSSEETHQGQVLTLLRARNIDDPRSPEVGVFQNTELQRLYDSLISQGKQSETEAYKVGVIIEEKDIADITKQLATATDEDIVATLEALRNGSENHLRAFNRQLSRY